MAIDRDGSYSVQGRTIGTSAESVRIANPGYVLIYNSHATAIITVYPGVKTQDGIVVGPGMKRSLPFLPGDSLLWVISDTASTGVQVWWASTKWGFDWIADELVGAISALTISPVYASGDIVAETSDTAQTASATVAFDLTTLALGWGSGFSFIADQDVDVEIRLVGYTTPATFIVAANTPFTFPPGPMPTKINLVNITDRSGVAWHIDFVGY